jgi:ABC-type multidrug transport system fused ATPase/permease subunit
LKSSLKPYGDLLAEYVRPEKRQFALLSALLLGKIGLQLASPQFMRTFIDTATGGAVATGPAPGIAAPVGQTDPLLRSGLLFLIAAILQQAANIGVAYVGRDLGWKTTNALRADLAAHCLRLDLSFHNARTPGEMIERIDGDVNSLSNFFSQFVIELFGNALLLIGVLAFLFQADWRAGLVLTVFTLVTLAVVGRLQGYGSALWKKHRQASADLYGFIEERLAGTEDIRASGATAYVMRRFHSLLRTAHRTLVRAGTLGAGVSHNSAEALFAAGSTAALAVSASLFASRQITIGTVYLILHYTNMLRWPIANLARQVQHLQQAGASVKRVQELFAIEPKIVERPPAVATTAPPQDSGCRGGVLPPAVATTAPPQDSGRRGGVFPPALSVTFEHVSFGYEPEKDAANGDEPSVDPPPKEMVLRDVSFSLAPGAVLGLLGRTGSGKTTLCRLLFRLYDPDEGTIQLSHNGLPGADIRTLRLSDLRSRVGIVTQDIQLFQASVRDNLTLFDPSVSDARIQGAIEALGMGDWLASLPEGLDTELASGGRGLSAGEAQLLALTRIFMQDPALVVLDEASSRLDPATEALLEHAIDALLEGRTAIVIAHRLRTVQRADEILILKDGAIAELGPRLDLARDPTSHFYRLLQTGLEEVLA